MAHAQIQPYDAHRFLSSIHVIPWFRILALETSLRARVEPNFQRIQEMLR